MPAYLCTPSCKLARETSVAKTTLRRLVKENLDMGPRDILPGQVLTPAQNEEKLEMSMRLLHLLKHEGEKSTVFAFKEKTSLSSKMSTATMPATL